MYYQHIIFNVIINYYYSICAQEAKELVVNTLPIISYYNQITLLPPQRSVSVLLQLSCTSQVVILNFYVFPA